MKMKKVVLNAEPREGLAACYDEDEGKFAQLVYYSDRGYFIFANNRFNLLTENDESISDMRLLEIERKHYKTVRDIFANSVTSGTAVTYVDLEKYVYTYEVKEAITAAVETSEGCPPATSDIALNLANRENAIKTAGYGPMNPALPNNKFWQAKTERWSVTVEEAKTSRCGNCAVFIQTPKMLDCIASGLGNESGNDAWGSIEAGDLGYCEAFDFKCASSRTCDAWVAGGPVTEESK